MFLTGILKQANSCALFHHNNSHLATLISIPAASCCAFTAPSCHLCVIVQLRLSLCVPTILEVSGASKDGETILLCLTMATCIRDECGFWYPFWFLKIIAIGISRGTPPVRPICHSDFYLGAHINKVANTSQPLPGFMNTMSHLYLAQTCFYLGACVSLPDTPHPSPDPSLTTFGRSGETFGGVCGGPDRKEDF